MAIAMPTSQAPLPYRVTWVGFALGVVCSLVPVVVNLTGQPGSALAQIPPPPASNGVLYGILTFTYFAIWLALLGAGCLASLLGAIAWLGLRSARGGTGLRMLALLALALGLLHIAISLIPFAVTQPIPLWYLTIWPA